MAEGESTRQQTDGDDPKHPFGHDGPSLDELRVASTDALIAPLRARVDDLMQVESDEILRLVDMLESVTLERDHLLTLSRGLAKRIGREDPNMTDLEEIRGEILQRFRNQLGVRDHDFQDSRSDLRCTACGLWHSEWSGDPCPVLTDGGSRTETIAEIAANLTVLGAPERLVERIVIWWEDHGFAAGFSQEDTNPPEDDDRIAAENWIDLVPGSQEGNANQ